MGWGSWGGGAELGTLGSQGSELQALAGLEPAPTCAGDYDIFRNFVNQLLNCYELKQVPVGVFTP